MMLPRNNEIGTNTKFYKNGKIQNKTHNTCNMASAYIYRKRYQSISHNCSVTYYNYNYYYTTFQNNTIINIYYYHNYN